MNEVRYAGKALQKQLVHHVPLDPLRSRVEVDRPAVGVAFLVAVHLLEQIVEHGHFEAAGQEKIDEVRADESGPAGDERHVYSR